MARRTAVDAVDKDRASTALDKGLRRMFRTLQARPTPDRLRSVVDQLDEGEEPPVKKRTGRV